MSNGKVEGWLTQKGSLPKGCRPILSLVNSLYLWIWAHEFQFVLWGSHCIYLILFKNFVFRILSLFWDGELFHSTDKPWTHLPSDSASQILGLVDYAITPDISTFTCFYRDEESYILCIESLAWPKELTQIPRGKEGYMINCISQMNKWSKGIVITSILAECKTAFHSFVILVVLSSAPQLLRNGHKAIF